MTDHTRAGILLLSLGEHVAAIAFSELPEETIEAITAALGELSDLSAAERDATLQAAGDWLVRSRSLPATDAANPAAVAAHLGSHPAEAGKIIADWCGVRLAETDPDRFVRREIDTFRASLFDGKSDPPARLRYSFLMDRGPGYAWELRENEIVLRLHDPDGLIAGNDQEVFEARIERDDPEAIELARGCEADFTELVLEERRNLLGQGQYALIELPRSGQATFIELLHLQGYRPADYRDRLVGLVEELDQAYTPAHRIMRVLLSPISRMSGDFLAAHLTGESDTTIAFLRAHLPARSLEEFVEDLPAERRTKIRSLQAGMDAEEFRPGLFREVERILERRARGND